VTRKIAFALGLAILLVSSCPYSAGAEDAKTFIRMNEVEIKGQVEHPEITYIIPKTRIVFKPIPLERDFGPETVRILTPAGIEEEIRRRELSRAANQP